MDPNRTTSQANPVYDWEVFLYLSRVKEVFWCLPKKLVVGEGGLSSAWRYQLKLLSSALICLCMPHIGAPMSVCYHGIHKCITDNYRKWWNITQIPHTHAENHPPLPKCGKTYTTGVLEDPLGLPLCNCCNEKDTLSLTSGAALHHNHIATKSSATN